MCKRNHANKHIKLSIGINSSISCICRFESKFQCTMMYTCEKSSQQHELFMLDYSKNSTLNLLHVNVTCLGFKKS
jgi:hypothetical protein